MVRVKGKANAVKEKKKLLKKMEKAYLKVAKKKLKKGDMRGLNMMFKKLSKEAKEVKRYKYK